MKKTPELFDLENEARKKIEFSGRKLPEIKVGQIRRYYVGLNIGQEISKGAPHLRPCIILDYVEKSSLVHIVPLSTQFHKKRSNYYVPFHKYKTYHLKQSRALIHQCITIDKKRLIKLHINTTVPKGFITYIQKNKL